MYFSSLIINMLINGTIIFMTMLTENRKLKIREKFISKHSITSLVESDIIIFLKTEKSYHLNTLEAEVHTLHYIICLLLSFINIQMWLDLLLELRSSRHGIFNHVNKQYLCSCLLEVQNRNILYIFQHKYFNFNTVSQVEL